MEIIMDIYTLLKTDHDKVKRLLNEIDSKEDEQEQQKLLEQLSKEIFTHNQAEEQSFYKALLEHPETKALIPTSEEEHDAVENFLIDLETERKDRKKIITTMKDSILMHVEKEETQIFPKSKKIFEEEELSQITQEFLNAKKDIEKEGL